MKSLSRVRLLATPWIAAYQAPPSMGVSRQEYWSGVPLPSPTYIICRYQKKKNQSDVSVNCDAKAQWSLTGLKAILSCSLWFSLNQWLILFCVFLSCHTDLYQVAPLYCIWNTALQKDLTLSQLLKLLVTGQVVINSMPLIISITVGFYTALQCKNQKYPSFSEVYSAKEAAEII